MHYTTRIVRPTPGNYVSGVAYGASYGSGGVVSDGGGVVSAPTVVLPSNVAYSRLRNRVEVLEGILGLGSPGI